MGLVCASPTSLYTLFSSIFLLRLYDHALLHSIYDHSLGNDAPGGVSPPPVDLGHNLRRGIIAGVV